MKRFDQIPEELKELFNQKAEKILKHYYRGVQINPFRKDFL